MAKFTLSPKAESDLADIWKYVAQDSAQHADRLLERFYRTFALLAREPRMGVRSDEIRLNSRRFPVGNYFVYYGISPKSIQIVHVFHSRRDQRTAMRSS